MKAYLQLVNISRNKPGLGKYCYWISASSNLVYLIKEKAQELIHGTDSFL
jgi:hypothetical protein